MKLFICFAVLLAVTLICAEQNLEEQKIEEIEPISQNDYTSLKDQSKRTIFGSKRTDWAKHVGVNNQGRKHVLGYGPVDYKYVPVIKPLILKPLTHMHGWRSVLKPVKVKPVHLLPVKPVRKPFHQGGWRPMIPANVPLPPVHPTRPWKEGWPENKPSITLQPPLSASGQHEVVVKPSPPSPSPGTDVRPVVDVRPVLEPPVTHLQPVPQFPDVVVQPTLPTNHLVPVQPFVPQSPPLLYPEQIHPLIPFETSIFQLQKPQLPVLPLGASFPSQVLQPGVIHAKPVYPQIAPVHPIQPAFPPPPPPHSLFHIHPNFPVHPPVGHPVFGNSPSVFNTHHIQPFIPSQPGPPLQPVQPAIPLQPVQPAIPLQPVQPTIPLQPVQPAIPLQPVQPAIPLHPAKPLQPVFPPQPNPQSVHPPLSFPVQTGVEFHGKAAHLIPLNRPIFGRPHLIPQAPQVPQGNLNPNIIFHNTHGINHPGFVHPQIPHFKPNNGPQIPNHFNPGFPQIPDGHFNPNAPQIPNGHFNPNVPQIPNGHFNPNVPQISDGNFNLNVPQIPDGSINPNIPQIPDGHFNPNVPQIPDGNFNPNVPQIPHGHFNPNVPQIPDGHFNPNVPQIPDGNFNSNVPQIPDGNFNPNIPQIPDGNFNPNIPQIPDGNFNPNVPQAPDGQFNPHMPQIPDDRFNSNFPQIPNSNFNPGVQTPQNHFVPGNPQEDPFRQHFPQETPQDNFNPGFGIHHQPQEPQQPVFPFHPANPDRFPTLNLDPAENLPEPRPQPSNPNNEPEQSGQPNFSIQPGQTDIQIPFHLPSHPGFRQNDVNVFRQNPQPENVFPNTGDGTQEQPFNGYVK